MVLAFFFGWAERRLGSIGAPASRALSIISALRSVSFFLALKTSQTINMGITTQIPIGTIISAIFITVSFKNHLPYRRTLEAKGWKNIYFL